MQACVAPINPYIVLMVVGTLFLAGLVCGIILGWFVEGFRTRPLKDASYMRGAKEESHSHIERT